MYVVAVVVVAVFVIVVRIRLSPCELWNGTFHLSPNENNIPYPYDCRNEYIHYLYSLCIIFHAFTNWYNS
jgi:hypothetical protein